MPYFCLKAGFSLNFGLNPISSVRTEKTKDSIDLLVSLAGEEASLHDDWRLLGGENASSSDSIDLLFSLAGEEASLHDDWLLAEGTLAKNLNRGGLER
jgi:hypothetical protein